MKISSQLPLHHLNQYFKEHQEIISAKVIQNGSLNSEKIEMFQINRHKLKDKRTAMYNT
jgi:hypothetical protein